MKTNKLLLMLAAAAMPFFTACSDDDNDGPDQPAGKERIIVVCEGNWGMNNSTVAVISDSVVTNNWFENLGDTGNDVILVGDTVVAIAVNTSNLVQFIGKVSGADLGSTEIPNVRKLAASEDGKYIYATSYANDGYVARIDASSFSLVDTCNVGYEPEGIVFYNNRLYVANTGGYHDYCEHTVSVIDADEMKVSHSIETGYYNLYGPVSLADKYLLLDASGNYYDLPSGSIIINLETEEVKTFDFGCSINCTDGENFYIIDSEYDENWQAHYTAHTISISDLTATDGLGVYTAAEESLEDLATPCSAYISPVDKTLYIGDARNYSGNGYVYAFGKDGSVKGKWEVEGVNPGHFLSVTVNE